MTFQLAFAQRHVGEKKAPWWEDTKIKLSDQQTKCYAKRGDGRIMLQLCIFAAGKPVKVKGKI